MPVKSLKMQDLVTVVPPGGQGQDQVDVMNRLRDGLLDAFDLSEVHQVVSGIQPH